MRPPPDEAITLSPLCNVGFVLIYPRRWNRTAVPNRPSHCSVRTGRRRSSVSSSQRFSNAAALRARRGPRACRGRARIACACDLPARRSTRPGVRRSRSTPASSPTPSRAPPRRRGADARWALRRCGAGAYPARAVAAWARGCRVAGAPPSRLCRAPCAARALRVVIPPRCWRKTRQNLATLSTLSTSPAKSSSLDAPRSLAYATANQSIGGLHHEPHP